MDIRKSVFPNALVYITAAWERCIQLYTILPVVEVSKLLSSLVNIWQSNCRTKTVDLYCYGSQCTSRECNITAYEI